MFSNIFLNLVHAGSRDVSTWIAQLHIRFSRSTTSKYSHLAKYLDLATTLFWAAFISSSFDSMPTVTRYTYHQHLIQPLLSKLKRCEDDEFGRGPGCDANMLAKTTGKWSRYALIGGLDRAPLDAASISFVDYSKSCFCVRWYDIYPPTLW